MEFNKIIERRKSVRAFTKTKADWKFVFEAIDTAIKGPFAGNHNNLKFLIIEENEAIKKIAQLAEQLWISQSQILIVVCSDDTQLENLYGERGRVYSRQQAGAAIQTLIFKLIDLGLASCWVGAYTDELIKQLLKIPQHIQIEAIIPVGYEDTKVKTPQKRKKSLENVIYWENWKNEKRPPLFKEPKETLVNQYK